MPKLAVLTACNQVLFDEQQAPSMIGVFVALDVLPPPDVEIQTNAMSPKEWVMCSMWLAEDNDIGKEFVHKMKVVSPNGADFGEGSEAFKMMTRSHTVRVHVSGLPVGHQGNIVVNVWLESNGEKVSPKHKYEISIYHRKRGA